ncbi:MAG: hypothetical protein K2K21_02385 [Lachnospiraceae bacterium]|nr:hypothetical protein [Lachnospiraceae bacterium]
MKKIFGKKKIVMIVLGILLAIILLVPETWAYRDGGTVEYHAILYSVKFVHAMAPDDYERDYIEGTVVTILGIKVFDNVDWEKEN